MALRFRDRFFTPPVARALTSPTGILLAGAGAAVSIVAGLPIAAAAGIGALAWAARVAIAIPRRARGERIDPFTLDDPWRRFVTGALQAQARYGRAAAATPPGPLRERLHEIGSRLDDGVGECWRVAKQGQALVEALGQLSVQSVRDELGEIERQRSQHDSASLERTAEALRAQLSSADRMANVARDARDRLQLLEARLDEAVARAIELSVGAGDDAQLSGLGSDVDSLVGEMEALRQALEETGGRGTALA